MDWSSTAFVFPGQGSQFVGMGKELAEAFSVVRELFQQADDTLGFSLSSLCFDGPEDALNDTINTQPALYVCGIAALRALQTEIPDATPAFCAGHSLGEFTALAAVNALTFEDGLRLVRERGRLMKAAGEQSPGAMAALLGLEADQVRDICERVRQQTGGVLVLANDNCPGQIVISGDNATLDRGLELAREAGVKRAVKLAVSIAAHSPLMESASQHFRQTLAATSFQEPAVPIYGNVSAELITDVDAIREELNNQLTQSVRWTESVQAMVAAGANQFIEFGAGEVLSGLLRRIDRSRTSISVYHLESLRKIVDMHI